MRIAIAPMMLIACLASPKLPARQMQKKDITAAPMMPCPIWIKTLMFPSLACTRDSGKWKVRVIRGIQFSVLNAGIGILYVYYPYKADLEKALPQEKTHIRHIENCMDRVKRICYNNQEFRLNLKEIER